MKRQVGVRRVGPRVHLRILQERDREELIALKVGSRDFLKRWEATPENGEDPWSSVWFDRIIQTAQTDEGCRLVICRNDDDRILGQIGIGAIMRGAAQTCFVGYWIGKPYARRGYMTESLVLALGYIFEDLGLHRVEANIIPANRASKALVARLGFRYEGLARRYLRINHAWRDHERWAMTAEDWRKAAPRLARKALNGRSDKGCTPPGADTKS